jgi:hypothetical protein
MMRLVMLLPLLAVVIPSRPAAAEPPPVQHGRFVHTAVEDWLPGLLSGLYVDGGDLRLQEGQSAGEYLSAPLQTPFGLNAALAGWHASLAADQTLTIELRSSLDGQTWTDWRQAAARPDGAGGMISQLFVLSPFTSWLQYRLLFESGSGSPWLADVTLIYLNSTAGPALIDIVSRVPPAGPPVLTPPPATIVAVDWGARMPDGEIEHRRPSRIVLSEVPAPADDPNSAATVRALQWAATELLGLAGLPYHFLIDGMGTIYQGPGAANVQLPGGEQEQIDIALLSDVAVEGISEPAQAALVGLLGWLGDAYQIAPAALEPASGSPVRLEETVPELQAAMDQAIVRSRLIFAGGDTGSGTERLSLLNRDQSEARAVITVIGGEREERRSITVPAGRRVDVVLNGAVPIAGPAALVVESDRRIDAERTRISGYELAGGPPAGAPARAWYFAAGGQNDDRVALAVLNPQEREVPATLTFFRTTGEPLTRTLTLAPRSRQTIELNELVDDVRAATRLVAAEPIVVERTIAAASGAAASVSGSTTLSRDWLFAEGSTMTGYTTTLALLNPWPQQVAVTVRVLSEDGTSLERRYALGSQRQSLIGLNSIVPNLPFSLEVEAERPIVAERLIRFDDGQGLTAGLGALEPATQWVFVEGSTAIPAEEFLLIVNPQSQAVDLVVRFLLADGATEERAFTVGARSRLTVAVNAEVPARPALSALVIADLPVVAERTIYANGPDRRGAETNLGLPGR